MVARVLSIARGRFYYGWIIVATGFAIQFMVSGLQVYGLPVFVKPMSQELGWTRAMFSSVQSVGTLVSGLSSFFVGPIMDKRGGRVLMALGLAIVGGGVAALSFVGSLRDFYLMRGIVISVGMACAGGLTVDIAISNWFIRNRGKAVSFAATGLAFGGVALAPIAAYLISAYGWRAAWVVFGLAIWVVAILPVALFMRRRPEDVGLLPDGDRVENRESRIKNPVSTPDPRLSTLPGEVTWTRPEAVRTSTLWLAILAFGLANMGSGAVGLHLFPFFTDIGMSVAVAAGAISAHAAGSFVSKLVWGILMDKYQVRRCAIIVAVLGSVAQSLFVSLSLWPSLWLVYFAATFNGLAMGGRTPLENVLWASYFGRLSLGTVRGIAYPFSVLFSAGGPLFAGWAYDNFHSYRFAWTVFTATYAISALLIYIARVPQKTRR